MNGPDPHRRQQQRAPWAGERLWTALLTAAVLALLALGACDPGKSTTTVRTLTLAPPPAATVNVEPERLALILARGRLNCGVNDALPGFGNVDDDGEFAGLEIDFCRALASALLGDRDAVGLVPLASDEGFAALAEGRIDVLLRGTAVTQVGDVDPGVDYAPTLYFDGQQLLGHAARGFSAASGIQDLAGAAVCVHAGSDAERRIVNAADRIRIRSHLTAAAALAEFAAGTCDAVTDDGSDLIAAKAASADGAGWVLFPAQPLSSKPLAPALAAGQSRFADVVRWTLYAMLIAEEHGVDSQNLDVALVDIGRGELGRLFGVSDDELQTAMGIPRDAFYQVVRQVGNYAEVFERNLGRLGVRRGRNALYRDGGLHVPAPSR